MHAKYQSTAKLIVQNVRTAAQLSTSNVDRLVSQGDISPAEINTELDLLESDDVARRALGLKTSDGLGSAADDRAVRNLEHALTVETVHQSNVVDLKVLANSPGQANADLQHVIDAYFEERAGTARNSGAAGFFDSQLKAKTQQLDDDQAALTTFQVTHGIADLEDQTKLQLQRVSALQDQLAQIESSLAAQRAKVAAEQDRLGTTPARSQTAQRTVTNQYSQERLGTALVDLQSRRIELAKRYAASDRQVIETDEKIARTQDAIATAAAHPATEDTTDVNPVWQQLSLAVAASGGEISALEGQRLALRAQILAGQKRLNELEEAATAYGELRRKVQQSQADYTLYAQRRDEARISEALDREKLFNVAVLERPIASPEPVRPKPLLYIGTATVFALLLGVALAVYADMSGGQVHSPAQLEAVTGTRTLATLADEAFAPHLVEANRVQFRRILFAIRQNVRSYPRPSLVAALVGVGGPERWSDGMDTEESTNATLGSCIALTSALKEEGVSFVASHLATEAARQASSRVAVFDMAKLMRTFETTGAVRLATRLDSTTEHWTLTEDHEVSAAALDHRAGAQGHFASALRPALEEARRDFDVVLLDCPSLQSSTLALELASCVDGYIGVVAANGARKQNIDDLLSQLAASSAPALGYLLNRRHYPVPRWLYRILW